LNTLYFFMHQHNRVNAPMLSKYLIEKLNQVCHLHLPVPQMHDNQGVLFLVERKCFINNSTQGSYIVIRTCLFVAFKPES